MICSAELSCAVTSVFADMIYCTVTPVLSTMIYYAALCVSSVLSAASIKVESGSRTALPKRGRPCLSDIVAGTQMEPL